MDGYITIGTSLDLSGLEKKLDKMTDLLEKKSVQAAENAAKQSSKRFNAAFAIGVSAMSSIMTKLISSVTRTIGDSISRVDTLQNFPRVMSNLGISAKDAGDSINYMSEKLIGLPTTLDDGASAVQRFTSANGNVKASTEMFLALNNAILAGGAPMEQQANALEQLSQAYAKGKPDMQEWRTAMTVMPAQLKQVADAMGYISTEQLGEALRSGEVSMNDFMTTLVKMNKQSVNGYASLEEQARTGTQGIQTSLTNLRTAVVKAGAEILQTIGQQNIANFFNNIIKMIKAVIPYISAFVKSFMNAINIIVQVVSKVTAAFNKLFGIKSKKDTQQLADNVSDIGYSMGGLADNTDDAIGGVKKLNKELSNIQSFDEMNVLQDTSQSGTSGIGDITAGVDVGELGNIGGLLDELNDKIEKLKPSTDLFTAAVWGLVGAWGTYKTLKILDDLGLLDMKLGDIAKKAAGIGLIIAGLILIFEGVIDYMNDPSWENFGKTLQGIGLVIIGLGLLFLGFPAIVTGAIVLIVATIIKYWDKIQKFLLEKVAWLESKIDFIKNRFGFVFGKIYEEAIKNIKGIINWFDDMFNRFKYIFGEIIYFIKNVFTGNWKGAFQNLINIAESIMIGFNNTIQGILKGIINGVLALLEIGLNYPINKVNDVIGKVGKLFGGTSLKIPNVKLPRLAKGGILNNPGRGVPVGGAIAGEAGREFYMPLQDEQMLNLVGQAIGKYVSLNATIPVYVGNRQIAREIRRIDAESDFAFNK